MKSREMILILYLVHWPMHRALYERSNWWFLSKEGSLRVSSFSLLIVKLIKKDILHFLIAKLASVWGAQLKEHSIAFIEHFNKKKHQNIKCVYSAAVIWMVRRILRFKMSVTWCNEFPLLSWQLYKNVES